MNYEELWSPLTRLELIFCCLQHRYVIARREQRERRSNLRELKSRTNFPEIATGFALHSTPFGCRNDSVCRRP